MTESSPPNPRSPRTPPTPEPFPDAVGRPEVSKGLFGDLFKRKGKGKKSATRI